MYFNNQVVLLISLAWNRSSIQIWADDTYSWQTEKVKP